MKRNILLFLVVLLPVVASAYDAEINGIYYNFSGDEAMVTYQNFNSYNNIYESGYSSSVVIPESVIYNDKTYKVTSIGGRAFSDCSSLISVTIGAGVLSIGNDAFNGTSLKKVIWLTNTPPAGYKSVRGTINYVANNQYTGISNINVYPYLSSLFEVDGIKYVPVSPSERTCDAIDCAYNEVAENINIGETVTYRGISLSVKQVKPYLCYGNTFVKAVNLSYIGGVPNSAFEGCNIMQAANLGQGITSIGNNTFRGCLKLESIVIPDSVEFIGNNAFENCSEMTSVKIGNSIQTMPTYAFSGCSSLSIFQIPKNVTTVGNYAFYGCTGLKTILMDDGETNLSLGSNGSNPLFANCPLDSVYIGRNISYQTSSNYGYSPFYRNTSLRSIAFSDRETEISMNEFYGCTNMKNVRIGDGVTAIGDWSFSGCSSLDYFAFGSNVKKIGKEAFSDCTALTSLISRAAMPPTCGSQALDDINKWKCTLAVPQGYITAYQQADQWKEFFFIEDTIAITPATGISLNQTTLSFNAVNQTATLIATITPSNATNKKVTWTSSNTSVATVSGAGVVASKANGTAVITAKTTDGTNLTATCKVIVDSFITFADANVKTICVAQWDTNGDGKLSKAEAAAVTTLDKVFKDNETITSFNELQYFTKLTSIGDNAFDGCYNLTSVTIPKSVTSIGERAFYGCGITSITIPESVTSIGERAFYGCGITSITIPESVTSIGNYPFSYCSSLASINVEQENEYYDSRNNCNAIIETATNTLIAGCKKTTIPEGVTNIGNNAFSGCSGLTSITIPEGVTSIGDYTFYGCSGLTTITIPEGVTSIGDYTFYGCSGLTTITIPEGATSIGEYAFYQCSSLTSITIPEGVTSIRDYAFYGCRSLTSMAIPSSSRMIKAKAFSYCTSLSKIIVTDIAAWCGIIYDGNSAGDFPLYYAQHLYRDENTEITNVVIPKGITRIEPLAFRDAKFITSITIPSSVTFIGREAFRGMHSLTSINIPQGITSIEPYVLQDCQALISVSIPEGVTTIGEHAFRKCYSLTKVVIPSSVTEIGNYAFRACSYLKNVYCYTEDIPLTNSTAFNESPISSATLHVPATSIEEYKRTAPWSGFGTIVALTEQEIADVIEDVKTTTEIVRYDIHGRQISTPQKGINIIQFKDGTKKKVLIK